MNDNYLEITHMLAGVPYEPDSQFYPTPQEIKWASQQRDQMDAEKVVMWTLSGSSVHKVWPYVDQVVARLMLYHPGVKVVFCGDVLSQIGEQGWEAEPRVLRRCGKWSIRETLTFAKHRADLVIGPETGVMNSIAFLDIPKILLLSHSSVENLSRDWINCKSMVPGNCECYPCHMLHYGFEYCNRDSGTGVALCQARITADDVWAAMATQLRYEAKRAA